MLFVVDASVVVSSALAPGGLAEVGRHELVAPALIWSEATSALHELLWREQITVESAERARQALGGGEVRVDQPADLHDRAWAVSERLGWAKTYDAEYVALAELRGAPLLTLDGRLHRGAARLVETIAPTELPAPAGKGGSR